MKIDEVKALFFKAYVSSKSRNEMKDTLFRELNGEDRDIAVSCWVYWNSWADSLYALFKEQCEDSASCEELTERLRSLVSCQVLKEEDYNLLQDEWGQLIERIEYENTGN